MSKVNNQSHHNDVNGTVLVFLLLTRTYITYCYVSLLTLLSWLSKNKVEVKIFLKLDPYWHLTMLSIFHFTQTRFVDVTLKAVTVYVNLKERDLGIKKNMISSDRDLYREEIYCISQVNLNKNDVKPFLSNVPFWSH